MKKTNAMRLLDNEKVEYKIHDYTASGAISGKDVANSLGQDPESVFKTLVTQGKTGEHYVFVIPVDAELNLKKAAKVVGEKHIAMIHQKELLPLTGYIHGGCSPLGMKKQFRTVINETAELFDVIMFSGGKIGCQIEVSIQDLTKALKFDLEDVI